MSDIVVLEKISVANLTDICRSHMRLSHSDRQTRASLYSAILGQPTTVQDSINAEAKRAIEKGLGKYGRKSMVNGSGRPSKRQRLNPEVADQTETDAQNTEQLLVNMDVDTANTLPPGNESKERASARQQVNSQDTVADNVAELLTRETEASADTATDDTTERLLASEFLNFPSQETLNNIISDFIDATGNDALKIVPCGSCARETKADESNEISINDIPNKHHLIPHTAHPAHELIHGLLIYAPALGPTKKTVHICNECRNQLKKNLRPRLSLSNEMWIGDVPQQLKNLTLPERLLIAKYYPSAYIVKLFPKHKNAFTWDRNQMHNGLRGNVSTYRLDPRQVASMIDGRLYPSQAKILSATIGVTFIGPKGYRDLTMPAMFRVRRWKIREALVWLKANNPLYSDIEISEERLSLLPVDGVPEELTMTAKYSTDTEAIDKEHEGYVPTDAACDIEAANQMSMRNAGLIEVDEGNDGETGRSIPIQAMGVVDIEGCDISSSEIMAHALANTVVQRSDDYIIKRGSAFVNEYARTDSVTGLRNDGGPSNPNHLLGSFPTLFPYGKGGFEVNRPIDVPYETHSKWSMLYADKRFRKDYHFPFQIFGVCQKREICRSSVLQMKRPQFTRQINLISTIKPQDLLKASEEETRRVKFSNPAVQALRNQLSAVRTRVKGTDEARQHVRPKIWGTNLVHNPPMIWITINPADTQDPIAQVYTGSEIDLDDFCDTAGPNNNQRATNIAEDPFSSAKYFHFIVKCVLEILLGITKKPNGHIDRKEGVFGKVQSYVGTVEAQGRGTLHLHMLLWLKDAPSATEMKAALKSEIFRDKLVAFIKGTIRASIGNMSHEQVVAIPKTPGLSYSRPLDPRTASNSESEDSEKMLVRALQFHQCSLATCLRIIKGKMVCKRRAPFNRAPQDWVNENGEWGPKRLSGYLNNWNPTIMRTLRANHDAKLIIGGNGQTATLTYYITNYATKKQQRSSNASALLAKRLAFVRLEERTQTDLNKLNKKLIQSCANCLSRDQEFSGPEIISYIMEWADVYLSNHYVTIFWDVATSALKRTYPSIEPQWYRSQELIISSDAREETVALTVVDGTIELKDQLRDYSFRGEELADMDFFEFMLETYEDTKDMKDEDARSSEISVEDASGSRGPGRPRNERIPYLEVAGKGKRCRIKRLQGHETLPTIVGKWICRSDNVVEADLFRGSVLMLLKPWRKLNELKTPTETFKDAYDRFISQANEKTRRVVTNIQYYHECSDGAKAHRKKMRSETDHTEPDDTNGGNNHGEVDDREEIEDFYEAVTSDSKDITEEDIERAQVMKTQARDRLYSESAIALGYDIGFFKEYEEYPNPTTVARKMQDDEGDKIRTWEAQLKATTREQINKYGVTDITEEQIEQRQTVNLVEQADATVESNRAQTSTTHEMQGHIERLELARLNADQRRAHDIVEERLKEHITNGKAEQLRMLILGAGGVGKTTLIRAITETFRYYNRSDLLAKCATTGITAVEIGASTLHSWAAIPTLLPKHDDWLERSSKPSIDKRRANMKGKEFLIVDEVSMEDKVTAYCLSEIIGKSRAEEEKGRPHEPFGSMHIIKLGDFHQFPPVGNPTGALYVDRPDKDSKRALLGREIFLQFDQVIILDKQNRIRDETWADILSRLRVGECNTKDIEEIERLVLTNPACDVPDFTCAPWDEAILITPRHSVRNLWNEHALAKHCMKTGNQHYIVPAEDTSRDGSDLTMEARLAIAGLDDKKTGKLPATVHMAIGMKAMVLLNIATEADVANGTRGEIQDIILDDREESTVPNEDGTIELKYPPVMLLFRPYKKTNLLFPGLPPGIIPLTPSLAPFAVTGRTNKRYRVRRRQYAMTSGYAFTDYKSQGQTIEFVIIDIGKPPTGTLSPFSVYVALSRSRGRETIRLLRDFDPHLFQHHPSEALRTDMERLQRLNETTKRDWIARGQK